MDDEWKKNDKWGGYKPQMDDKWVGRYKRGGWSHKMYLLYNIYIEYPN